MPSDWASSGVVPRALAVSLVLPKKRLCGGKRQAGLASCMYLSGEGVPERSKKGRSNGKRGMNGAAPTESHSVHV